MLKGQTSVGSKRISCCHDFSMFYGSFQMAPDFHQEDLEEAFQYEVLKMLKKEGKINDAVIENMLSWHHCGFHVYIGNRIWPDDESGLENLAKYIVRACFSQGTADLYPRRKIIRWYDQGYLYIKKRQVSKNL